MNRLFLLLSFLTSIAAAQQTLATLNDNHRVLLLFAPSDRDPRYQQQLTLLSHHFPDLGERDLFLLPVLTQSGPQVTPETLRILRGPGLSDQEQLLVRNRFRIAPEAFAAILLGKDGGEKLRSLTPLTIQHLDRTIDAMPMRQNEMRNRSPH